MGSFTIVLKKVLTLEQDPGTGLNIGLGLYPIYDEDHRLDLNRKIINHYWNREIGMETISLFVFALQRKMNEIMPFYNQVYKSRLLEFDPISNYKLTTTRADTIAETGTQHSTTDSEATSSAGARAVSSSLPQTQLARNKNYASSGADNTNTAASNSDTTVDANSSNNSNVTGESTTAGYQGNPSDMLLRYQETLINIDMMIVTELEECFMQVWDTGEEMLPQIGHRYYR